MNYSLTRETKNPTRGHMEDAGIDIYVPYISDEFCKDFHLLNLNSQYVLDAPRSRIIINPHSRIKLPTGVYFNIPENNMLLVLEKTSVPNKTGIISGARVIDENYQGEFIASLINTSDSPAILNQGQKFIQVVLTPINPDRTLYEVKLEDLYPEKSNRGSGAYGSTGHN